MEWKMVEVNSHSKFYSMRLCDDASVIVHPAEQCRDYDTGASLVVTIDNHELSGDLDQRKQDALESIRDRFLHVGYLLEEAIKRGREQPTITELLDESAVVQQKWASK